MWEAAHFAQGFFRGAKVGTFDAKDLEECLAHEPETDKMLAMSAKDVFYSFRKHSPESGVKGLILAAKAMVEMVKETAKKDKNDKESAKNEPVCGKVFFSDKHDWKAAEIFEKEVFDEKTTIHYNAKDGKMYFNNHDITGLEKPLADALRAKDYDKVGWLLAATLVKEEGSAPVKHNDFKPHPDRKARALKAAAKFA